MFKKILLSFALAALSIAGAATHTVTFVDSSVGKTQVLKAGDYRVDIKVNSIVIAHGQKKMELPASIENGATKFKVTKVLYNQNHGKFSVQEIQIGGTNQKVTFDSGVQTGGGE
jgi:hypothetical protein